MGGHQSSRPGTHVWLTPPWLLKLLGAPDGFDLDPCASIDQPWRTAREQFTVADNGLIRPWSGRVWLNPPYETHLIRQFMSRMAEHGRGMALIFARTDTEHFQDLVLPVCDALFFIRGRLFFHHPDGRLSKDNGGAPSVLCAYGPGDAEVLAELQIEGAFTPLRLRWHQIGLPEEVEAEEQESWSQQLLALMKERGSITMAELYGAFACRTKIAGNRNWRAKLRQKLQQGPYRNVARGQWELAI